MSVQSATAQIDRPDTGLAAAESGVPVSRANADITVAGSAAVITAATKTRRSSEARRLIVAIASAIAVIGTTGLLAIALSDTGSEVPPPVCPQPSYSFDAAMPDHPQQPDTAAQPALNCRP